MLRLGLTGGIASGKSAVAGMLRELGFPVLDADALAHRLMEPGQPAHDEVLREFGAEIAGADGRIDRAKLAAVVFADREKLERLNGIVHPRVLEEMQRQFAEGETRNTLGAAFVEAALIIEAGYHKLLDGVVVTWCKPEQQLARLLARGLSAEEARRRIAAQMPVEEKLRYATERIDCSGTLEETRKQVAALAAKLRRAASRA
ncbi:MAG: dephospho-CoA kinase [Acidobacteria bacterium 13_1_40CM_4_61_5]|nr:MAG: dephospho-CoA kinase [Acidobacteria bacterium 13_1_40CM_4_61_5]OLE85980.1 MAG: dephospho-CoA kinase [Acidobacteria bacterium 13_1_20CM_2_60_10]